jgi:hypothetical protein
LHRSRLIQRIREGKKHARVADIQIGVARHPYLDGAEGRARRTGRKWMRPIVAAALCLATAVAPAHAAELDGRSPFVDNQRGAFAGARVRASLGGAEPEFRASLTLAPTAHSRRGADSRMAMGDGLELSFTPVRARPELRLAGKRLDQMSLWGRPAQDRKGLSTLATVAIVTGVIVVAGTVAFVHVMNEASCLHGSDC